MNRRKVIKILLVIICLVCLGVLGYRAYDLHVGHGSNEQALDLAKIPELAPTDPNETDDTAGAVDDSDPISRTLAEMDLSALQQVNPDVIGWIYIPNTVVSYPMLIGVDNQEYLRHTWQKEYSTMGSIFLECNSRPDLSDFNTIIYGHRMRDMSMFACLQYYNDKTYWAEHPSVYVVSDLGVYRYDIYASYETSVRSPIYELYVTDPVRKGEIIQFGLNNSVIDTGIVPTAEDQIVTLSTCPSRGTATRWIVQGVLTDVYPIDGGAAAPDEVGDDTEAGAGTALEPAA